GPSPSSSATLRLSASSSPMNAKFSGSAARRAPAAAASASSACATARFVATSGPEVICKAATFTPAHPSYENDVVLIGAVERLHLQTDRPADLAGELRERRGLLREQQVDDILVSEDEQLAARELAALPNNVPEDILADALRCLHEPSPLAARARHAEQVLKALARALARHLDEAERGEAHDARLRAIRCECALESGEHLPAVGLIGHVDEIDDDD